MSDHDLKVAADQAFILNTRIEERLAREQGRATQASLEEDRQQDDQTSLTPAQDT